EQPEGVDLQMAGGRTRLDASNADESSPQKAMPQAPVSGAGQAPAGAAPEAEESEGYGYSYDDDPLSAGGFDETERLQPESDSVEPDSAELMVEESSAAQDYEVESKRGCGCRIVGAPSTGGVALGLGLGLLALGTWRRRRQRTRAALGQTRGSHQHQPAPAPGG